MADKIQKVVVPDAGKGAKAPRVTVVPNTNLREGARAPQIVVPSNIPKTPGPVSVTPNKK
jgi:hypothetical protein